jgi:hypothetical protein
VKNAVLYFDILRFLAKQFSPKAQFTTSLEFGTPSLNTELDDIRQSFSISLYQLADNVLYFSLFPVEEERSSILNYKNTSERRGFCFSKKGNDLVSVNAIECSSALLWCIHSGRRLK